MTKINVLQRLVTLKHCKILSAIDLQSELLTIASSIPFGDKALKDELHANISFDLLNNDVTVLAKVYQIVQLIGHVSDVNIEYADEFLKGGHFMINDNGNLFEQLKGIGYERVSSHHNHDRPESHIGIEAGKTFSQLLVGKTSTSTWFQIENSPMPSLSSVFSGEGGKALFDIISHSKDFILYIGSFKSLNIGQYGVSWYPDSKPIFLFEKIIIANVGLHDDTQQSEDNELPQEPTHDISQLLISKEVAHCHDEL